MYKAFLSSYVYLADLEILCFLGYTKAQYTIIYLNFGEFNWRDTNPKFI
jgi:hypothetical protein